MFNQQLTSVTPTKHWDSPAGAESTGSDEVNQQENPGLALSPSCLGVRGCAGTRSRRCPQPHQRRGAVARAGPGLWGKQATKSQEGVGALQGPGGSSMPVLTPISLR